MRVLGIGGGTSFDIIGGIQWALGLDVDGVSRNNRPVDVISLSLGGPGSTTAYEDIINDISQAGALVFVAAGNDNVDANTFTPAGGTISVMAQLEGAGDMVAVSVCDTGCGIRAAELPLIFERFYRADPSRNRATGGAGLGLTIVRQLVEAHGGSVRVTSEPGHGSCFTFTLPAGAPTKA